MTTNNNFFCRKGQIFYAKDSQHLLCYFSIKDIDLNKLSRKIVDSYEIFYYEDEEIIKHLITTKEWNDKYEVFNSQNSLWEVSSKSKLVLEYYFWTTTLYLKPQNKTKAHLASVYEAKRNDHVFYLDERYRVLSLRNHNFGRDPAKDEVFKVTCFIKTSTLIADRKKDEFINNILVYDCETAVFSDSNAHEPYLLAWHFYIQSFLGQIFFEKESVIYEYSLVKSSVASTFLMQIQELMINYELTELLVYGYNNFNFDDHLIMQAFQASHWHLQKLERQGKVTSWEAIKKVYSPNGGVTWLHIVFCDLVKWLPDVTLAEATKEMGTIKKMDVDVITYNRLCQEKQELIKVCDFNTMCTITNSKSFLEKRNLKKSKYALSEDSYKIFELIIDYCVMDINSTHALYMSLQKAFVNLCNYFVEQFDVIIPHRNILKYISPAYFISLIYKQIFDGLGMKRIKVQDHELATFFADAYYGGWVSFGFCGEYVAQEVNDIKCFDVTAMYPTAMSTYYPVINDETDFLFGDQIDYFELQNFIDNVTKARDEAFEDKTLFDFKWVIPLNDRKFIVKCDLTPPPMDQRIPKSSLPCRYPHCDVLVYDYLEKKNYTCCSSEMKTLILTGWKITILKYKYNIVFLKTDRFFNCILDPLNKMKVIAKENSNQAEKKLVKLWMNSLSGKLGQRPEHRITVSRHNNGSSTQKKGDQSNFHNSVHYLAAMITAEARYILFRVVYEQHKDYLFNKLNYQYHCGLFLYADTDSITFDSRLTAPYDFEISNDMGTWENEDFKVYWKEKKYPGIKSLFCLGRKSYVPCDANNKPILWVLKGIHRRQMETFTYDILKGICNHIPKTIEFKGLVKKKFFNELLGSMDIFAKKITEDNIKKTLSASPHYCWYQPLNEKVYEINKHNLEQLTYKEDVTHFLHFTTDSVLPSSTASIRYSYSTTHPSTSSLVA